MKILDIHNQQTELTIAAGQEEHLFLSNPTNVGITIRQEAGSTLMLHCVSICPAEQGACEIIVSHCGSGCTTRLKGMALLKGEQQFDLTTRVMHYEGGGTSEQLFKFVLDDNARGSFYGELKVLPDAQKTEARQTNRNILLSRTAKMQTKPQLEIYADDVKCSHGATTGQLDQQALFYMQQRGIALQSAKRLLLAAFLEETLTGLPESDAEQIRRQIEEVL